MKKKDTPPKASAAANRGDGVLVVRVPLGDGGQRSGWQYAVTPAGLEAVTDLARRGCSLRTIMATLGIGPDGWKRLTERQPEVLDALATGRAALRDRLVGKLVEAAEDGAFIPAIFLTKSLFGFRDSGEHVDPDALDDPELQGGVIVVPQKLTPEEWLAAQAAASRAAEDEARALLEALKPQQ